MCRVNFRIKLDLCKFYNDVRRFCWVFVDGSKMFEIAHMKEHITKLFNIKEPFHLLLNETEYLPPNEDIRILKENETIVVAPGSGLDNELELSISNIMITDTTDRTTFMQLERNISSVQDKQSQTSFSPTQLNSIRTESISNEFINNPQNESSMTFYGQEDSKVSNEIESKSTDVNIIEDFNATENLVVCPKRKRVRRRKKKAQSEQMVTEEEESKPRKPKIINSCIISSGKHIRFDNIDNEEIAAKQVASAETINGSNINGISPSHELANLLSLGQNSTPLTFTNTRVKEEVKIEHMSDEELQLNVSPENISKNEPLNKEVQNEIELDKDLCACPIMTAKPEFKDVIAFKMLKIGSDYTPQVSDFIVAEVISYCPKTSMYTFKVLRGLSEVQVPVGKFTVIQDEEEHVMTDTITLNYAQIIEPRLISASNPDSSINSIHYNN